MKLLIDSSVYIAFFNDSDVFHKESVAFLEKLSEGKNIIIVLPILVFLEVTNVLYKKISTFDEKKLLRSFNNYEKIDLRFDSTTNFLTLFKQLHLKTSDAIIATCAKLSEAMLVTWDEKFQKGAKKFVDIKTPKEFKN